MGFEPTTSSSTGKRSAIELQAPCRLHRKRTRFYHKRSTPQSGREDNLSEPQYCLDLFPKHLPGFDKAQTRVEFFCRFILRLIANPSGMDTLIGPKNLQHLF